MKVLYEDGNVQLSLTYLETLPFLHVKLEKFSKDLYKKYLVLLIKTLKENKLNKVYSSCSSRKARRFNEMFGFKYLCNVEGKVIMEYTDDWL